MRIDQGIWICHRGCGHGEFPALVQQILGCTTGEAHEWIASNGMQASVDVLNDQIASLLNIEQPAMSTADQGWKLYYESLNANNMPLWFLNRGFTWETIFHWKMRYDMVNDAVVIPIYWQGELVGTITRNNRLEPKYVNSPNLPRSEILFGEIITPGTDIILVEGLLDTVWLWQLRYNAFGLLGTALSKEQVRLLQRMGRGQVTLGLDNDKAGKEGTDKAVDTLVECGYMPPQIKILRYPSGIKDPQDCSPEIFAQVWNNRRDIYD